MFETTDETILKMFEAVHGRLSDSCRAEVIYNDGELEGVACIKDGMQQWIVTPAELAFDITAKLFLESEKENLKKLFL